MAGFPSRQPWTNIALAAALTTLLVAGPMVGWPTAVLLAVLAPAAALAVVLVLSLLISGGARGLRSGSGEGDADDR